MIGRGHKIIRRLRLIIKQCADQDQQKVLSEIASGLERAVVCGDRAAADTERGFAASLGDYWANRVFGAASSQLVQLSKVVDESKGELREQLLLVRDDFQREVIDLGQSVWPTLRDHGFAVAGASCVSVLRR